jgi:hypothetical protein
VQKGAEALALPSCQIEQTVKVLSALEEGVGVDDILARNTPRSFRNIVFAGGDTADPSICGALAVRSISGRTDVLFKLREVDVL